MDGMDPPGWNMQTTPTLLPVVTHPSPSPATYRSKSTLALIGLQVVLVSILIVIGFVTLLSLPLALFASMGAIIMLAGNTLIKSTNNITAASIGAVGGLILSPLCLLSLLQKLLQVHWFLSILFTILHVILFFSFPLTTGLIGCSVLLHFRFDLDDIKSPIDGITTSLGGGLILGFPGALLFIFVSKFDVLSIFSPICVPIKMGVQWVHVKWTDSDPETIAELQNLPGRD